ncbi:hypothetical protein [Actinomadura rugatobispora]|uniref:C2H2-type domain-containing protein n=1 Tax=Actinomadura rugatobispora TaxID=1994 RepID=A0ABW0ZUA1_9ACTN|nr:hypothetical protein GCM10010200_095870 [Actinomadura rugatobispora]
MIATYCDRCYQADQTKTETSLTIEVSIGTDQARLDLCPRCDQGLLDPLRELISTRAAAQRALDRSAGASPETEDTGQASARTFPNVAVRCGHCQSEIALRSRSNHARNRHGCKPQDITWDFGEDIAEVWICTCDLAFPTEHGRNTHAHRTGHALPDPSGPQPPPR